MNNRFIDIEVKQSARVKTRAEIVEILRRAIVAIEEAGRYEDEFARGEAVSYSSIPTERSEPWVFGGHTDLRRRLESRPDTIQLGDICNIDQGVTAGGDQGLHVFLMQERRWREQGLEDELMCRVIGGGNIRAWRIAWQNSWFIYPYKDGRLIELGDFTIEHANRQRRRTLIEEGVIKGTIKYPKIAIYLSSCFDELINREAEGKTWTELGKKYYALHRPREAGIVLAKPKIVCPRLAQSPRFALDTTGYLILDSCIALVPRKDTTQYKILEERIRRLLQRVSVEASLLVYLLAILNSSICEFLNKTKCAFVQNRYYQVSTKKLAEIPIPTPSSREALTRLIAVAEDLVDGQKKSQEADTLVCELFQVSARERKAIHEYNRSH